MKLNRELYSKVQRSISHKALQIPAMSNSRHRCGDACGGNCGRGCENTSKGS